MARLRAFVTASVGALSFIAAAHAADAPGSWSPLPEFERAAVPVTELASGWYLRGDVGYRFNRINSVNSTDPIISQKYDNVAAVGLGFGYKYQWFRTDLTLDYALPAKFQGTTATATTQPQYNAKLDSVTTLANLYLDLGTWAGFTPYVGGGVGFSFLRTAGYTNSTLPASELVPQGQKWSPSWAWMAGVNFQVSQHLIVDVGYRHLNLGDAVSGIESTKASTTWKRLSTQEARVGLRFLID